MAGSTSISIAYGIETLEKDDPYISHAEETMAIANAAYPGTFSVDYFPFRAFFIYAIASISAHDSLTCDQ